MADTRGFDVVAEVKEFILQEMLRSAWDNGGTADPGAIPHEVPIPAGTALGPYQATGGQVSIPKEGLSLVMAPADNGVTVSIAAAIQVELDPETTHLESFGLLDMQATIGITAPFGQIPDSAPNIGIIFDGLPRDRVTATLTSGNPIDALTIPLITEYIHGLYEAEVIPHTQTFLEQSFPPFSFDVFVEFFDDQTDLTRRIEVSLPSATEVQLSIPTHIRLSNITGVPGVGFLSPMGVTARLVLVVPFSRTDTAITALITDATLSVVNLTGAAGIEGTNYATAQGVLPSIDALFTAQIEDQGQALLTAMGDMVIPVPSVAQIEQLIGDEVHDELLARRFVGAWTPTTPEGSPVTIDEVRPKALDDALAIAINPGEAADENALIDFIPSGSAFAIALDQAFVEATIQDIVNRPEDQGGFGGIPKTFPNISGHRVDLKRLSWDLRSGRIHFEGSCTCHDVFCGADADIDFWADVGLRWAPPAADGTQALEPFLIDSDASLPWWAWLLAILTFIFSIIIGVIWLVITIVVEKLVERLGAAVITDEVTGQLQVLGAWPQELQGVGTVTSTFDETVIIEPSGLVFTGSMLMTARHALTSVLFARTNGPYAGVATQPLLLQGSVIAAPLQHDWVLGDGAAAAGPQVEHRYRDNGVYVARIATLVDEAGGALTHHSTLVRVANVRPTVDAGPDIHVTEGESFNVTGRFEDPEWVDTHKAYWDFGDDTLPVAGLVTETNEPPSAKGTVSATHAYCNNGEYTIRLQVWDTDGGVGEDTLTVLVDNVPPEVSTDSPLFAYPCVPVNLFAHFIERGWCDTHTATWQFGDGDYALTPTPAVVREINKPPVGYGYAVAVHTYHTLATHLAHCIVTDTEGATGAADLVVHVVDLMNKDFEHGFKLTPKGAVANEWYYYGIGGEDSYEFSAEDDITREGRKAQRVWVSRSTKAGIWQSVGANICWDYQVTTHFHTPGTQSGVISVRLGIDPNGGTDPSSPSIVWTESTRSGEWCKLLTRATAKARKVTVFLEAAALRANQQFVFFDAVEFQPFPCPLPEPRQPALPPPPPRKACVDWTDVREAETLPQQFEKADFVFRSLGQEPQRVVFWGSPTDRGKLAVTERGLWIQLPFTAQHASITVGVYSAKPVQIGALDAQGKIVAETSTKSKQGVQTITLCSAAIFVIAIRGGGGEGALIEICISSDKR